MQPARDSSVPETGPSVWVRRMKAEQQSSFIVLSPQFWGIWTHFDGTRTTAHAEKKHECEGCKRALPKRWKGYLYVWNVDARTHEFLELPPVAAAAFRDSIGTQRTYRGIIVQVKRGRGDKSRLKFTFLPDYAEKEPLRADLDPWPTLRKLWGHPPDADDVQGRPAIDPHYEDA